MVMTADNLIAESERSLAARFRRAEEIAEYNQEKVLKAFQACRVALRHFNRRRVTVTATKEDLR